MKTLYYCLIIICILIKSCLSYEIPLVRLDVLTNGFTIGLPDDPGILKVFYVINVNDKCPGLMELILESKNQLWSTTQTTVLLQSRDMVKISLLVNHNGEAYKSLQHIVVGENNNKATLPQIPAGQQKVKCGNKSVPQSNGCDSAQTIVKGLTNVCQNQLIFEENFDSSSLDMTKWSYDIRNLLTGKTTEEFVVFDNREENIFLTGGYLNIKPTFTKVNMRQASIDFGSRCTPVSTVRSECKLLPMPPHIYVPPVNSSQIHTRNSLNFKYGRVEIKAKLPKGDWLVPYIMLQNYGSFDRKQIRIAFARGNERLFTNAADSQDVGGRRLSGGIVKDEESRFAILKETYNFEHYGNTFHIYTLSWTNGAITLGVDGKTYGEIRENLNDYNDDFFLTLGVSAGGHLEFPDNLQNSSEKPWENTSPRAIQNFWQSVKDGKPEWNGSETMQIDYVKIYAI